MVRDRPEVGVAGRSTDHLLAQYDALMSQLHPTIHELQVRLAHGNCSTDEREAIRRRLDALKPTDRRPNAQVLDAETDRPTDADPVGRTNPPEPQTDDRDDTN